MEKIDELRAQGMSMKGIANELGITFYSVRKHLTQSRQPGALGTDLAQPRSQEQIDELKELVLELQKQLRPILKERAKAREQYEEPTTGFKFNRK